MGYIMDYMDHMDYIDTFKELLASLTDSKLVKKDSLGNRIEVRFSVAPGASQKEISDAENKLNVKLPETFREFLSNYNGARLYDYEGIGGFQIFGTNDLVNANIFARNTFEEDWDNSIVIFAKHIGESNCLGFKIKDEAESPVVDCFFEELPNEWKIIDTSFSSFMSHLLDKNGAKYWLG
jgi:hypothetical protein